MAQDISGYHKEGTDMITIVVTIASLVCGTAFGFIMGYVIGYDERKKQERIRRKRR